MQNAFANALVYAAAGFKIDDIMTRDFAGFRDRIRARLDQLIAQYHLAIIVDNITLQRTPPIKLRQAIRFFWCTHLHRLQSDGGTLRQSAVQLQRKMVIPLFNMISKVPRPLGEGVQPCMGSSMEWLCMEVPLPAMATVVLVLSGKADVRSRSRHGGVPVPDSADSARQIKVRPMKAAV